MTKHHKKHHASLLTEGSQRFAVKGKAPVDRIPSIQESIEKLGKR